MEQMTLSNAVEVPEQYRDVVVGAIHQIYHRLKWDAQEQFGLYDLPAAIDPLRMMIADPLAQIARAATGDARHSEDADGELTECIQTVMEVLFSNSITGFYHIPDEFWSGDLGKMIARARLWLQNDLVTISEAAHISGVSVPAVTQAVDAGRLAAFVDPDAPQRQGRRLVSEAQVNELWNNTQK